jgi:hypothetical protein
MQILDRIENKMDKETDSSKSRSRRSHDENIRETRSVERNQHHSPKNSFRKVQSRSSSSHVVNHKRRIGMDKIHGEMNKIKPPTFDGEHKKDEYANT